MAEFSTVTHGDLFSVDLDLDWLTRLLLNRLFAKRMHEMHKRTHETHSNQAFWVVFRGVSAYTVHWVSRAGLFQCQL